MIVLGLGLGTVYSYRNICKTKVSLTRKFIITFILWLQSDVDSETDNTGISVLWEISSRVQFLSRQPVIFMWFDKSPHVAQQNISMKICGMSPTVDVVNISHTIVLQILYLWVMQYSSYIIFLCHLQRSQDWPISTQSNLSNFHFNFNSLRCLYNL